MKLAEILTRVNSDKNQRQPGQWTPAACALWREGPQEVTDLLYAALVWELGSERLARPDDEGAIRKRMAQIAEGVAAARAKATAAA
jgi:hypothetical protein